MVYEWKEFKFFAEDIHQPEKIDELSIVGFFQQKLIYDLRLPSVSLERARELSSSKPGALDFMAHTKLTVWCDSKLTKLPQEFARLTELQTVTIEKCPDLNFSIIFSWLTTLPKLKELYLSNCKLKEIPGTIGELTNLEVLSFAGDYNSTEVNTLETLPPEIGKLKNLKSLCLDGLHKTLKFLPIEVANLENLNSLTLRSSRLPLNLDLIPNLTELDLTEAYYSYDQLKALLNKQKTLRLIKVREDQVPRELQSIFLDLEFEIETLPIDGYY